MCFFLFVPSIMRRNKIIRFFNHIMRLNGNEKKKKINNKPQSIKNSKKKKVTSSPRKSVVHVQIEKLLFGRTKKKKKNKQLYISFFYGSFLQLTLCALSMRKTSMEILKLVIREDIAIYRAVLSSFKGSLCMENVIGSCERLILSLR